MTPEQITRCLDDYERIMDIAGDMAMAKEPFANLVVEYVERDNRDIVVHMTMYYRGGWESSEERVPIDHVAMAMARNDGGSI